VVLTGKYSHLNGVIDNGVRFDGGQQTVAKLLQKAGYQTAMIGKWHLKSLPTGFDYFCVLPGQGAYHNPTFKDNSDKLVRIDGYVTDIITDKTIDFLKQRKGDRPFFVMCHHKAPHRNWQPDDKHARMYEDQDIPLPETFWDDYKTRCDAAHQQKMHMKDLNRGDLKAPVPEGLDREAEMKWRYQRYIKDYLRCIASVDDNVGRLLKYLDESHLAASTVVIYTSDQGFYLGDHGWFDKRFMYEESLSMPLVVRYPKEIQPGSVNEDLVLNLDFAETFLDYAGAPVPGDMQGRSLRAVLRGKTPADWRKSMYYHYYEYPGAHSVKRHYGVRTRRHKLIHFYHDIDAWELFDLQKDPHELNNVYDAPAYADVVKELKAELARLQKQYGDSHEQAMKLIPQRRSGGPKARPKKARKGADAGGKKAEPAGAAAKG
jgi:arylsulfatase A-like enzyme